MVIWSQIWRQFCDQGIDIGSDILRYRKMMGLSCESCQKRPLTCLWPEAQARKFLGLKANQDMFISILSAFLNVKSFTYISCGIQLYVRDSAQFYFCRKQQVRNICPRVNQKQVTGGMISPDLVPPTYLQNDFALWFLPYVSFISSNLVPVQWCFELQSNFMATGVAEVPWIFLNSTLLILIPDICTRVTQNKYKLWN